MTERELNKLLSDNPDIRIVGDGGNATVPAQPRIRSSDTSNPLPKLTEHELQVAVIEECDRRAFGNPLWGYIYANVNGQYRPGQRMEPGLRPGVPDLFVPVARHGYHGAYVELKVGNNQPSPKQRVWIALLAEQGYIVKVFYDDPALVINWLDWYLEVVK